MILIASLLFVDLVLTTTTAVLSSLTHQAHCPPSIKMCLNPCAGCSSTCLSKQAPDIKPGCPSVCKILDCCTYPNGTCIYISTPTLSTPTPTITTNDYMICPEGLSKCQESKCIDGKIAFFVDPCGSLGSLNVGCSAGESCRDQECCGDKYERGCRWEVVAPKCTPDPSHIW
jgi:hypothetical protein